MDVDGGGDEVGLEDAREKLVPNGIPVKVLGKQLEDLFGETESKVRGSCRPKKQRDGRKLDATHVHRADVDPTVDEVVPELNLFFSPLGVEDIAG